MKHKIAITGQRVHNVGYRPFLISLADDFGIEKFEVHNSAINGKQTVIAKLEAADDDQFNSFFDAVQNRKPRKAEVSDIEYAPFEGRVRSIVRTSMMSMNTQLAKGIDAIESTNEKMDQMLDKRDQMLDKQDETIGEIRDLREDLARRDNSERLVRMEKDIRVIKSKLSVR